MKARGDMTAEQIEKELSAEELAAYLRLLGVHTREQEQARLLAEAQARTAEQVAEAIAAGVPAVLIAAKMGLTKQRVYQLRNQALAGAKA